MLQGLGKPVYLQPLLVAVGNKRDLRPLLHEIASTDHRGCCHHWPEESSEG
jgi:hypothetical protein